MFVVTFRSVEHSNFNHLALFQSLVIPKCFDMFSRICLVDNSKIEKEKKALFMVNSYFEYNNTRLTLVL